MDITVKPEIKNEKNDVPFENPKVESDIKIINGVRYKFEADIKIKNQPVVELDRNMEIITNAEIKNENVDVPCKKPKIEMDFKPKIETDIKVKNEPIDNIQRGTKIIDNMNIRAQVEIKNESIAVPSKKPKIEMDAKPKIVTDINIKSELSKEWQDLPDELILKIFSYSERVLLFPSIPFPFHFSFSKIKNCYFLPFSLLFPSTFKSLKK
jgi:hypothetical protein